MFLDLSLFYNEYDHLITRESTPDPLAVITDNSLYGETYGGEIAAHWQVRENWKVSGGYSFIKMQIHTENSSTDTSTELNTERSSPHNIIHLNSQMNLRDYLEFDTTFYYVGSVLRYNIPSYVRMDMGLTWHVSEDMDIAIVGQNILDPSHPEFGSNSAIPTEAQRGVFGKLTLRF